MSKLVSILIPVYNCEEWISRAVESALAQTWSNKEIIAIDDASTDGSWNVLQAFAPAIRVERVSINCGQNVTRNRLTELSHGEWLVYLDADDELAPDSVEKKMLHAQGADAAYGSKEMATFRNGERCECVLFVAEEHNDPFVAAFQWKYPNTSSFLFKRKSLLEAGGWNERVQNCTDYALYFSMLLRGCTFRSAPEAWSLYRQWSSGQAVNVAPLRKMMTRLTLMRDAATELREAGRLTPLREQAFRDAALGVLRTIYQSNRELALQEHDALFATAASFIPSDRTFTRGYIQAYKLLGFRGAETLAKLRRKLFLRRTVDQSVA